MRFDGEVAVVVGGAGGIGRSVASALAAEGARVFVLARTAESVEEAAAEIRATGGLADGLVLDATDAEDVDARVAEIIAAAGKIDILVTTVGGGSFRPFANYDAAFFDGEIQRNLYTVANTARAVLPHLIERNTGRMLFFTSSTGGVANLAGYQAGKAAVESLVRTLRSELANKKISVNALNPGPTDTALTRGAYAALEDGDKRLEAFSATRPYGLNDPDEVARVALFLVSEEARLVSGQSISLI